MAAIQSIEDLPPVVREKVEELIERIKEEEGREDSPLVAFMRLRLEPQLPSLPFLYLPQGDYGTWVYHGGWSWTHIGIDGDLYVEPLSSTLLTSGQIGTEIDEVWVITHSDTDNLHVYRCTYESH